MTALYHVGCGRPIMDTDDVRPGKLFSIACGHCRADSPICAPDLHDPNPPTGILPASLSRIMAGQWPGDVADMPHIETYLGYSAFTCPAKAEWETRLRAFGMRSAAECYRETCRKRAERMAPA